MIFSSIRFALPLLSVTRTMSSTNIPCVNLSALILMSLFLQDSDFVAYSRPATKSLGEVVCPSLPTLVVISIVS